MIHYLYVTDPGALEYSEHQQSFARVGALLTTDSKPVPPIAGTAAGQFESGGGLPELFAQWRWDEATATFIPAPAADRIESARDFLRRFTTAERVAIRTSADPVVQDFIFLLQVEPMVNVDSPDVAAGLGYFVSLGLVTEARKAAILA